MSFLGNRSLFSWVFGNFFSQPSNTSGLLAFLLVLSSLIIQWKRGGLPEWLVAAVFAVIGFYFGAKRPSPSDPPQT